MIIKIKQAAGQAAKPKDANSALATLQRLQVLEKPVKLIEFVAKLPNERMFIGSIFNCLNNLREALGKAAAINQSLLLNTYVQCNMSAKADTCVFGDGKIYMSYDLFAFNSLELTQEHLAKAVAGLICEKVYGANAKRFHHQLVLYLLGFDPMKELEEKAEINKALKAI